MRTEELNFPVQQYEHPRTDPMMNSCTKFSPDKWAALNTAELIITACCQSIVEARYLSRNPLYTVSSRKGVTMQ